MDGLQGARVFLVEDEALVALDLEDFLTSVGCEVVETASRLPRALKLAQSLQFDTAVLDVNIAGEKVDPVAELIEARQIPFVFATGYGRSGVSEHLQGHPVLVKPINKDELVRVLVSVLSAVS